MLSRRLLLGLPSQLPKNRRILTQNTSKADSSTNLCPPERGKGPASAGRGFPPGSRRIDVYSYKVPARPEAKSALQEWSRCVPLRRMRRIGAT